MVQHMKFTHSDYGVDFSEAYDDKTVVMRSYGKGNSTAVTFDENNLRRLRTWIRKQLNTINQSGKKKSKK